MFRRRERVEAFLNKVAERFRVKGALSESKALTLEELELPFRFKDAMFKRLGKSGIFIEVNGKYYLSEDQLKKFNQKYS
ncbi:hypothetical protein FJY84_06615 [Candidatus Bathyarchaeota archaeon]|nr:hypothetical protein [Candidatus Bathyarchaeota archaeon]